ncbi:hypothetical protein [Limoniibacter endophyticus]|uniref:Uncharacterized protein n=1 Tax=Limoniibacter endophyticus TaxID=1565040 RepID=A0A8J3DGZ0_9HYPH|nr:hypothetical protein [Limoniibacter endophyticus]GHC69322.1 hypothetical protein GCM10010136_15040 [Limoniibacter endophyticus]
MKLRVHVNVRKIVERLRHEERQVGERRSWERGRARLGKALEAKRNDAETSHDTRRN